MSETKGGITLDRLEKMSLNEVMFWFKAAVNFEKQKAKAIEEETSL